MGGSTARKAGRGRYGDAGAGVDETRRDERGEGRGRVEIWRGVGEEGGREWGGGVLMVGE